MTDAGRLVEAFRRRATPAAHACRHPRSTTSRVEVLGSPLAGAVPPRAGRCPLDRPTPRRSAPVAGASKATWSPRSSFQDALRRRPLEASPRRSMTRHAGSSSTGGGVTRAGGRPGPAGRGQPLRRDRPHRRHADARADGAARPPERLSAVPQGGRARAVLLRRGVPRAGSSRRPRRTWLTASLMALFGVPEPRAHRVGRPRDRLRKLDVAADPAEGSGPGLTCATRASSTVSTGSSSRTTAAARSTASVAALDALVEGARGGGPRRGPCLMDSGIRNGADVVQGRRARRECGAARPRVVYGLAVGRGRGAGGRDRPSSPQRST